MNLDDEFNRLKTEWQEAVGPVSNLTVGEASNHPACEAMEALGTPLVPIILKSFINEPSWLFIVLRRIVMNDWLDKLGVNSLPDAPDIPEEARGDLLKITNIWLEWGKNNNLL